jgi:hypothetical protein
MKNQCSLDKIVAKKALETTLDSIYPDKGYAKLNSTQNSSLNQFVGQIALSGWTNEQLNSVLFEFYRIHRFNYFVPAHLFEIYERIFGEPKLTY